MAHCDNLLISIFMCSCTANKWYSFRNTEDSMFQGVDYSEYKHDGKC